MAGFFLCIVLPDAQCEDERQGVVAGGVVHNIASDRKVEKIGGILQPEPLDSYLKRLFDNLSKKLDLMDERLQNIEEAIHSGLARPPITPSGNPERSQKK